VSGTSGSSGTSGATGNSGTSGTSGTSGANGTSGTSGATGASGTSGTSGTSGGGGGTTINPTNNYIPYRVNSTTFGDSPFFFDGSQNVYSVISGQQVGINLDYAADIYYLGDYYK
jgi:hypothetical protein